jgi:hypothetical protein
VSSAAWGLLARPPVPPAAAAPASDPSAIRSGLPRIPARPALHPAQPASHARSARVAPLPGPPRTRARRASHTGPRASHRRPASPSGADSLSGHLWMRFPDGFALGYSPVRRCSRSGSGQFFRAGPDLTGNSVQPYSRNRLPRDPEPLWACLVGRCENAAKAKTRIAFDPFGQNSDGL